MSGLVLLIAFCSSVINTSMPLLLSILHSQKRTTCSGLMKTRLNNVLLRALCNFVNNTEQVVEPELACNQV